ncbi:MFS transporter [Candidatus Sororendozoicomonas aggregata]|uniref:MFS transporter n=1 Tax=Candidatus Sororendozoicomonas aggregata TaxID=3073239 RepID=UPI002ED23920
MIIDLIEVFLKHKWLRFFVAGLMVSSIGNGLTFVVVNGQLVDNNASEAIFIITFLLFTFPAWLGNYSGKIFKKYNSFNVIIIGDILGLLGLIIPLIGVILNNNLLLMLSGVVTAYVAGLTFPEVQLMFKQGLSKDKLPLAAGLDTLIFSSNVLLGVGIGVILYGYIDIFLFFIIDGMSFLLAIALFILSRNKLKNNCIIKNVEKPTTDLIWSGLKSHQKVSILLLPILSFLGAPLSGLLPKLAPEFTSKYVLTLLFVRSFGQLLAPLILPATRFKDFSKNKFILFGSIFSFIGLYLIIPFSPSIILTSLIIFLAHLLSNVYYSLSTFRILDDFDQKHIHSATSKSYRLQMISMFLSSLITAMLFI